MSFFEKMDKAATYIGVTTTLGLAALIGVLAYSTPAQKPFQIFSSPGGSVFEFINNYGFIRENKTPLEVRGVCASACTFFLGLLPKEQVCYDDRAYLGFHGVYRGGFMSKPEFDQPMTEWTYNYVYTPEVINKLKTLGWSMDYDIDYSKNPTGLIWVGPEFMKELGYQKCDA